MISTAQENQKFILIAWVFLVGIFGWAFRDWILGPQTLEEKDRALARRDARMREAKRPEWWRRLQKRWMATGKLGDRKLNRRT